MQSRPDSIHQGQLQISEVKETSERSGIKNEIAIRDGHTGQAGAILAGVTGRARITNFAFSNSGLTGTATPSAAAGIYFGPQ